MSTGEDEPSTSLNGRLRPRKSCVYNPKPSKDLRKPDTKPAPEKFKRTSTPKAFPNKTDDLINKSESPPMQLLCPYCDKTFPDTLAVSDHVRRDHLSTTKQNNPFKCLLCNHVEADANDIIRHMVDNHPNHYFACYDCHTRFPSTTELAEHKLNDCEKQKLSYRKKLRQKTTPKKTQKNIHFKNRNDFGNGVKDFSTGHFNGIVISCALKSSHTHDLADIEDNITTNFILPPGKNLIDRDVLQKNAVIILDDLQWDKRIQSNFSFQTTDADQILTRLGVVHRSSKNHDSNDNDWPKTNDDPHDKHDQCFDTGFYTQVASNVFENLTRFLDGSFNFHSDPEIIIRTRKTKNGVVINTVEGFPILLACEQLKRNLFDRYLPRAIAPKHKWKWDNLENGKNLSPQQLKHDSHSNNCIVSLVASLDIWSQLCMRRKYDLVFNKSEVTKKQSNIGQELKEILESRELPVPSSQIVKYTGPILQGRSDAEFPASLGLVPAMPKYELKPAILSGEWVRPRCYVCCACGAQTRDSKGLSSHISSQHPNSQVQHYEIVGEVLLNSDIFKHLYIPQSQMNNRTRPLRGIKECTKCKNTISLEDLHQHMLDCAGDTPAVRRKCRYRPFGVRKRRPRLPDNTIRKKIRKDIQTRHSRKNHMRPRIRTEVGDAETIRKMLADLPAKRHRVLVKPLNPAIRPRRNLKRTRNQLILKKRLIREHKILQEGNSSQMTLSGIDTPNKSSIDPEERPLLRPFTHTLKRLVNASKILRKNTFNKKTDNEPKKESVTNKYTNTNELKSIQSVVLKAGDGGGDRLPIQQASRESNSDRINMNNGSINPRENGDNANNDNPNNRDNQNPGDNGGDNNNSRDGFPPPNNQPLKHSIANLTSNTETQDKAVQFHHLFLIQQEYNLNNNSPSGKRILFGNKVGVSELDKPPLRTEQKPPPQSDTHTSQKNKINSKPRKGLNDCIAMLRSKLIEPSSNTLPGHVSVQCGSDEPIDAEPVLVERRHSTVDLNNEFAQTADLPYSYFPKKNHDVKISSRNRGSRRSRSARNEKIKDLVSDHDLLQWRQLCYNSQMLTAQNITQNYTKQETSRRRSSVVSTDNLLLQHARDFEILSKNKRELMRFSEYQLYPNVIPSQQATKKNQSRDNQKATKSKTKDNTTTRRRNVPEVTNYKQTVYPKSDVNTSSSRSNYVRHTKRGQANDNTTAVPVKKNIKSYTEGVIKNTTANITIQKEIRSVDKSFHEKNSHNMRLEMPIVKYSNNVDAPIPPARYTVPAGPLDLSNKMSNILDIRPHTETHYKPHGTQLTMEARDIYDFPHRNLDMLPGNKSHFNKLGKENSTGLPPRRDIATLPTDLSINKMNYISSNMETPFHNTDEVHGHLQMKYVRDVLNPMGRVDEARIMHEYFNENSERIVVDNDEDSEFLGDPRRSEFCMLEEQMHLDMYKNNEEHVEENIQIRLSEENLEPHNTLEDSIRDAHYSSGATINDSIRNYDNIDTHTHCINVDQVLNHQYDLPIETSLEANFVRSSNHTEINYYKSTENDMRPSSTINLPASLARKSSFSNTSIMENSNFEEVEYFHPEAPISYNPNSCYSSVIEGTSPNAVPQTNEYEMNTIVYTLANDSVTTMNAQPTFTSPVTAKTNYACSSQTNIGTPVLVCSEASSFQPEPNDYDNVKPSSNEKQFEVRTSPVLNAVTSVIKSPKDDKTDMEISKLNNNNSFTLDHDDPETARKIAMLPKELVEILGTMPVDHRNQLLNVLPQYVSKSTSPVFLSNTSESIRRNSESSSGSSTSTKIHNDVGKEFKFESTYEDERQSSNNFSSKNLQYRESLSPSVTNSTLLTPPSERYLHHSQDSNENSMVYVRKSPISTEEQIITNFGSNKLNVSDISTVTSNTNAHGKFTEVNNEVIDLTGDDYLLDKRRVNDFQPITHTTGPVKDINTSVHVTKSTTQKTSSDKTASLRAVRIKTPFQRKRSLLSENMNIEKENEHIVSEQGYIIKDCNSISPNTIQQLPDVYTTQHDVALKPTQLSVEFCSEDIQNTNHYDITVNNFQETSPVSINHTLRNSSSIDIDLKLRNGCASFVTENEPPEPLSVPTIDSVIVAPLQQIDSNPEIQNKIECSVLNNPGTENSTICESSILSSPKIFLEEEDSEDDISLAAIIKQKHDNFNSSSDVLKSKKIYKENDHRSINIIKQRNENISEVENTTSDISSMENISKLADHRNKTTESINESPTNKDYGYYENNISSEALSKNNIRKGRLLSNSQIPKHSDNQVPLSGSNNYVNEIDKENNSILSSDTAKSLEHSVAYVHKSIIQNSSTINNPKEKYLKVTIREGCQPADDNKTLESFNELENRKQLDENSLNLSNRTIEVDMLNIETTSDISNVINKPEAVAINLVDLNATEEFETIIDELTASNDKQNIVFSLDTIDSELEDTSTTPIRLSRRGKSLYVDNDTTVLEKSVTQGNANEQRAPLTKKQLIFSKLLLDEEKHNNPSSTSMLLYNDKAINGKPNKYSRNITVLEKSGQNNLSNSSPDKQESLSSKNPVRENDIMDKNSCQTDKLKTNKRKIKPQSRRKIKKKKSHNNHKNAEDVKEELHNITAEYKLTENKKIICHSETTSSSRDFVDSKLTPTEFINNKTNPRPQMTEKRKSSNIDESLQIPKPKKCKLNDKVETTSTSMKDNQKVIEVQTTPINENKVETEIKLAENKSSSTVNTRHTTCYNKPGKRTRSKSVVVKSSCTELYDPYDIDLEDMLYKAETLDRTQISAKMSFSSFKSSIAAKTRKLSMTAPSAIIDISPTDSLNIPTSMSVEKDVLNQDKIDCHDKTNPNTKYGHNDSNESSKSDTPLKKYAEQKEKELSEIPLKVDHEISKPITDDSSKKSGDKAKTRGKSYETTSTNKMDEKISSDNIDNEKDLLSEKFMESFGFFSERRPRKSNLLATKKISETFHIISNDNDDIYFNSKGRSSKKTQIDNRKLDKTFKGPSASSSRKTIKHRKKKNRVHIQQKPCKIGEDKHNTRKNEELDSITSKKVEIKDARNRKNDLSPNLKETNTEISSNRVQPLKELTDEHLIAPVPTTNQDKVKLGVNENLNPSKTKRQPEVKDKMYPDIIDIDMFEDKFDKIKRKCRSQAAVAKQIQTQIEANTSLKKPKKYERKKSKKNSKNNQGTHLTKGSLKGFDGIKVSILTSDMNEAAIDHPVENVYKKKRKNNFRRKRDRKISGQSKISDRCLKSDSGLKYDSGDKSDSDDKSDSGLKYDIGDKSDSGLKYDIGDKSDSGLKYDISDKSDSGLKYDIGDKSDSGLKYDSGDKSDSGLKHDSGLKSDDDLKPDSDLKPDTSPKSNSDLKSSSCFNTDGDYKPESNLKSDSCLTPASSLTCDSGCITKEPPHKDIDVYEFLDTDDTELLAFRSKTERFKSTSYMGVPSTSQTTKPTNREVQHINESGSDIDDFVYMDELAFSEGEIEYCFLSCNFATGKFNFRPRKHRHRRKRSTAKNTVMGRIFRRVARSKRRARARAKHKANLDQLFDSLLEDKPNEQPNETNAEKPVASTSKMCQSVSQLDKEAASTSKMVQSVSQLDKEAASTSKMVQSVSQLDKEVASTSKMCHSVSQLDKEAASTSKMCLSASQLDKEVASTSKVCHSASQLDKEVASTSKMCHSVSQSDKETASTSKMCLRASQLDKEVASTSKMCQSKSQLNKEAASTSKICKSVSHLDREIASTSKTCKSVSQLDREIASTSKTCKSVPQLDRQIASTSKMCKSVSQLDREIASTSKTCKSVPQLDREIASTSKTCKSVPQLDREIASTSKMYKNVSQLDREIASTSKMCKSVSQLDREIASTSKTCKSVPHLDREIASTSKMCKSVSQLDREIASTSKTCKSVSQLDREIASTSKTCKRVSQLDREIASTSKMCKNVSQLDREIASTSKICQSVSQLDKKVALTSKLCQSMSQLNEEAESTSKICKNVSQLHNKAATTSKTCQSVSQLKKEAATTSKTCQSVSQLNNEAASTSKLYQSVSQVKKDTIQPRHDNLPTSSRKIEPCSSVTPLEPDTVITKRKKTKRHDVSNRYSPPRHASNFDTSYKNHRSSNANSDCAPLYRDFLHIRDNDYIYTKYRSKERVSLVDASTNTTRRDFDDNDDDERWTTSLRAGSPARVRSPLHGRSPARMRSPVRVRSPARMRSPVRVRSPARTRSPVRVRSPVRFRSPVRMRSPGRVMSTARARSPTFVRSPTRVRSPPRASSPSRVWSPTRATLAGDAGVATQRARRKCTVGKQNVLAETWSSESEPDGMAPRPNSAESVVASNGRRKRGRKREGPSCVARRVARPPARRSVGGGRVPSARTRPPPLYWSEGQEAEQEPHPQQHGWIVGDSHKKLVTMLAHAKGRRRHDDKRNVLE